MEKIEDLIDRGYLGEYVSDYKGRKVYDDSKRDLSLDHSPRIRCPFLPRSGKFLRSDSGRPIPVERDSDVDNHPRCEIGMISAWERKV